MENPKYVRAREELATTGKTVMTVYGNSMTPKIKSGATLTFERSTVYAVGDIVFCKVRGRYVDAHQITAMNVDRGYLISNNHGHDNGWTKNIFGKVVKIQ